MIFLDTSGILALADKTDAFHSQALLMFERAMDAGEVVLLHNYVVVESAALLQRRLSLDSSLKFLTESRRFDVHWVDSGLHDQAIEYLSNNATSKLSFVDAVSFLVMRSRGVTGFMGFDKHFVDAGFKQYAGKE